MLSRTALNTSTRLFAALPPDTTTIPLLVAMAKYVLLLSSLEMLQIRCEATNVEGSLNRNEILRHGMSGPARATMTHFINSPGATPKRPTWPTWPTKKRQKKERNYNCRSVTLLLNKKKDGEATRQISMLIQFQVLKPFPPYKQIPIISLPSSANSGMATYLL